MKSVIVPAQITTVEDRITGNLSFVQLLLFVFPVILMGLLFVFLPPILKVTAVKLTTGGILMMIGSGLAIRIKGELVLNHLITRLRYNLRPAYFVYDKNDYRMSYEMTPQLEVSEEIIEHSATVDEIVKFLAMPARVRLEHAIDDPRSKFQLSVRKGGLYVSIHEIKEESV